MIERLTEGLTLLRLTQAVLISVVTVMAVQNLPGLLELAGLRAALIQPGTRHAIATLCQYAVIAVGLTLLFGVLRVDWAKFVHLHGGDMAVSPAPARRRRKKQSAPRSG